MKYLIKVTAIILLLSSCQMGGYGSASVEASNGIVPPSQAPVVNAGVFGGPLQGTVGGPAAVAAERASKSKSFYGD